MNEHDHNMRAEDRPSPERFSEEQTVYEREFVDSKLTVVSCGHVDENGGDFAFEQFEYITEVKGWDMKAKAYQWECGERHDDMISALMECSGEGDDVQLAGLMAEIWKEVFGAIKAHKQEGEAA